MVLDVQDLILSHGLNENKWDAINGFQEVIARAVQENGDHSHGLRSGSEFQ